MPSAPHRTPRAWPQALDHYRSDPKFFQQKASQPVVDMTDVLHAVASRIEEEYINALSMYCAGQPELAHGYLRRAEYVYATYGRQENYERDGKYATKWMPYKRGNAQIWAAWTELALHGRWNTALLRAGLEDLQGYLLSTTYVGSVDPSLEDELRLLCVLCQMALGDFDTASAWLALFVRQRRRAGFERSGLAELLAGVQAQAAQGPAALAGPLREYFDGSRLDTYPFVESQSLTVCVPIAVLVERTEKRWQGEPVWDDALQALLY